MTRPFVRSSVRPSCLSCNHIDRRRVLDSVSYLYSCGTSRPCDVKSSRFLFPIYRIVVLCCVVSVSTGSLFVHNSPTAQQLHVFPVVYAPYALYVLYATSIHLLFYQRIQKKPPHSGLHPHSHLQPYSPSSRVLHIECFALALLARIRDRCCPHAIQSLVFASQQPTANLRIPHF